MDSRPIGVFDSGLGGITAVKKLMEVLPGEDIIYLGDTGRVPYGSRSRETIIKYARQDMNFLQGFSIKAIVIACGTVSTTALDEIAGFYDVPIFGVVESSVQSALNATQNGKIGVIGTQATIGSGMYKRKLTERAPEVQVFEKACPLFVPLVENGRVFKGDIVLETVAEEYLSELKEQGIDTLIMGCTHYPLIKDVISAFMGDGVSLVDSGAVTAKYVAEELERLSLLSLARKVGVQKYYVTDSTEGFAKIASMFLETDVRGEVEQVALGSSD